MNGILKAALAGLMLLAAMPVAAQVQPSLLQGQKWRMIGPYRGGRTVGASGNAARPNVFYIGVNNGGVWKTTDYGRTWAPVFDDQPTGSIGDVTVAPSNPDVIYAASGEGLQRPDLSEGDGIYRSGDGGKTWRHLGLRNGRQIAGLAIDPQNENHVFAAVLGHPYGPNTERGVYRTTNGGATWTRVLYKDENTGAVQVAIDPVNPRIVYASLWASRLAPWENGQWAGPGSGLYKSTDGGDTWVQLKDGLPGTNEGLGRIGFCIAPSQPARLYATVDANESRGGIYRSDDAGAHWRKINGDKRLWDRGSDFAEIKADPKNADIVYDANVVTWKSEDGGQTWDGFRGAPGGDDYHRLWINPNNPDVILLAGDQGAVITVNGGTSWSSWYNQPTAQLYHVSADNAFPYNLYSGQQESGSVGISSRGNDGAITFREWRPVAAQEYGYVVADPLNPDIVYGGKITRYDKRTGQGQDISPRGNYRFLRTAPIVFSPIDNTTLFYAGNVLFKTRDGGNNWNVISPDLTRTAYDVPACIGVYRNEGMKTMPQRGVIYTIALQRLDSNIIWAGTDDGLIQLTTDGGRLWRNVTPPAIASWSKISMLEASHTDKQTVYAAVNRIRLDDNRPHIYRTRNGGKTWKEIVNGLPNDPINTVKEDPVRKGLLFAGSERAVYVSFDDGENWQSLRRNMPATSIRDLVIKDNDIAVATHGRSFWIMDDITPLRQMQPHTKRPATTLYAPETACRVRWNVNTDTPLPPDEPVGENPPDGAVINYYLAADAEGALTIDILDERGTIVRHCSSLDTLYTVPEVNIPKYWIRPQQRLSGKAGAHRFLWDMHWQPLNEPVGYSMSAIYEDTPPAATSPWVMPGKYTIRLRTNGRTYTQPLLLTMDPRVKTSTNALQLQHDLSCQCYAYQRGALEAMEAMNKLHRQLSSRHNAAGGALAAALQNLDSAVNRLAPAAGSKILENLSTRLGGIMGSLQGADVPPTGQNITATHDATAEAGRIMAAVKETERRAKQLKQSGWKP